MSGRPYGHELARTVIELVDGSRGTAIYAGFQGAIPASSEGVPVSTTMRVVGGEIFEIGGSKTEKWAGLAVPYTLPSMPVRLG